MAENLTKEQIEARLEEIEKEEYEAAQNQWRYGIMVDRQHSAALYQEKRRLTESLRKLRG